MMVPTFPKIGVAHFRAVARRELTDILMRQRQAQMVFARFGKDARERIRRKVLELVDVKEKVTAVAFGNVHARHGRKVEPRDDHGARERRIVLADLTLRKVHDENFPRVHDLAHVERRPRLAQNIPD